MTIWSPEELRRQATVAAVVRPTERRRWFGLRSDGEPEGEGKKEKVQEDHVLTLEAWVRSVVKGKAGGDGN